MRLFLPSFKIVNTVNKIHQSPAWLDSPKFASKGRIVDAKGKTVDKEYQGRTYRLIAKKERVFTLSERLKRGFIASLSIVASLGLALFSTTIRKLFTSTHEKVRYGELFNEGNTASTSRSLSVIENEEYDEEYAIQKLHTLSKDLARTGRKLCLLIGRSPGETFPGIDQKIPDNERWVSLDLYKNNKFDDSFIPGKQLHLVMNMNDNERLRRIHKLFDKVLVDWSTLKFNSQHEKIWSSLGKLLRPAPESTLITETNNFCYIPGEKVKEFLPEEEQKEPLLVVSTRPSYALAQEKFFMHRAEENKKKLKDTYFSEVTIKTDTPYPFMYHSDLSPNLRHFILSKPQEKIWEE